MYPLRTRPLRPRARCVSITYGKLQFLFIAPERLRVPSGDVAKRKTDAIAIDEAHEISQWDRFPGADYRLLAVLLLLTCPAPVIALTATATPVVQRDICNQLGLHRQDSFIHGFRRSNIAIEVVETSPSQRPGGRVDNCRPAPICRPAIIYTPSRKQAESVAALLAHVYDCGVSRGSRRRPAAPRAGWFPQRQAGSDRRDDRVRHGH